MRTNAGANVHGGCMCNNSVSFSQKREEILTHAATWVNLGHDAEPK